MSIKLLQLGFYLVLAQACSTASSSEETHAMVSEEDQVVTTPVSLHGQLSVQGVNLVNACKEPIQLRGVSHFWHTWEGKEHWNANVVKWLRDDWKVTLLRAPIAAHPNVEGDYLTAPAASMKQLRTLVEGAIAHGMYIIVDFHAHKNYVQEAKEVFGEIAQAYGEHPNIVYAIWNEPVGLQEGEGPQLMWDEIKAFAQEVIPVIRAHDPNNIIVVPTPFYDQFPNVVAKNRLTTADLGGLSTANIMYDIHAYAGQHKKMIRDRADEALADGLPLIMTEVGRVGVNWGPDNKIDSVSFNRWMDWLNQHKISYTKWSLSYRKEKSSSLHASASPNGQWKMEDLTDEGRWNRNHFRSYGQAFYSNAPCLEDQ